MKELESKRLQKYQIEELGWALESETSVIETFRFKIYFNKEAWKSPFILNRLKYDPNEIQIYKYDWEELWPEIKTPLFKGTIINGTELSILMGFLNIKP